MSASYLGRVLPIRDTVYVASARDLFKKDSWVVGFQDWWLR